MTFPDVGPIRPPYVEGHARPDERCFGHGDGPDTTHEVEVGSPGIRRTKPAISARNHDDGRPVLEDSLRFHCLEHIPWRNHILARALNAVFGA